MPSSIQDFIGTFMQMAQVQNQQEQIENQRKAQAVQGVNTFMTIARQTADPALLTGLVDRFSALGVAPKEELLSILQHVTPTQEALQAYGTRQGMLQAAGVPTDSSTAESKQLNRETANTQLTGQNAGTLAASGYVSNAMSKAPTSGPEFDKMVAALASKTTAGLSPGQLVLDHALSMLPGNEIEQAAGVQAGTRLSAPQAASNELGWANMRQQGRQITQAGALGEAGMVTDLAGRRISAAASGAGNDHTAQLLATKEQLVTKLTDSKSPPQPGLVISYIGALNAINQQLTAAGIANEGQVQYSPEMLTEPGWIQAFKRRLAGQTNLTVKPVAPITMQPRPTGRK
jgi:hypothetical protein